MALKTLPAATSAKDMVPPLSSQSCSLPAAVVTSNGDRLELHCLVEDPSEQEGCLPGYGPTIVHGANELRAYACMCVYCIYIYICSA